MAISALSSLSHNELSTLKVTLPGQKNGPPQQEGIFDFIKTAIRKIGPFALDTAKDTIKRCVPLPIDVAKPKKRPGMQRKHHRTNHHR
jgi:hypothetical protein